MASNEDVLYVGMETSTQNQQLERGTCVNHQGLTGPSTSPPPTIPGSQLPTSLSPQNQQRGTSVNNQGLTGASVVTSPPLVPLLTSPSPPASLLMPPSPIPTGTPHAQQIQALNLLLQTVGGSSPSVHPLPKVRVVSGVGEGARKRVVLEREIKPSEEQEEINKMAKEEVHQTMR